MRGKFITIEGCDGAGKSTQLKMLEACLTERKIDVVFTREPGGTPLSERIRELILDPSYGDTDKYAELLLYEAARRQHVVKISKWLDEGKLVVCDRFIDSTLAYQGYGRGVDVESIELCNKIALGGQKIDLTIFLDLSPEESFARKGGADSGDRLETEDASFYRRVYEGYKRIAEDAERVVTVDASGSCEQIHDDIVSALVERGIL